MFSLNKLLSFDHITLQCHDAPDADTIASAYAVFQYLRVNNKAADIVYSGYAKITKSNLVEMLRALNIPIEYRQSSDSPPLCALVTVDCQYGAKNVTKFNANSVFIIDHHREEKDQHLSGIIRSQLGSCSTVVWDLLRKEHFDFAHHLDVCTALYYGLYTDTNSLAEINHPLDKDMRDSINYDPQIIKKIKNMNLSLEELHIAGTALTQHKTDSSLCYAIFKAEPCDQNILGFISDLALQVDTIDVCIVYASLPHGAKLSIRSCTYEVMASELAKYLASGVGDGGGHIEKAGGFIDKEALEALHISADAFIENRANEYFASYDVIKTDTHEMDTSCMQMYRKKRIPIGYALSTDIFPDGTPVLIRTLEGDTEAITSSDTYFMIGILGETYPISAEKFSRSYMATYETIEYDYDYSPTVRNKLTGESLNITDNRKACVAVSAVCIYARQLTKAVKVFTTWNKEGYMYGSIGDFIAVRTDDAHDIYVIRNDIFYKTYEPAHHG